ncbi:unnamed protein product [Pleuronectes platessa]|uniref:Uncharacterized protein n=1 Tax=Pleuronectes platessa TaxID=8262 RepID=A0A9N7Z8H0_PLEPL|nr:unnamed protein product [Pleuronectes platessa]
MSAGAGPGGWLGSGVSTQPRPVSQPSRHRLLLHGGWRVGPRGGGAGRVFTSCLIGFHAESRVFLGLLCCGYPSVSDVSSARKGRLGTRRTLQTIHQHQTEMTSLCRNLLFFLFASPLLHSHLFTHSATTSSPSTRPRIRFINSLGSDDDYEDDYNDDDNSSLSEVPSTVKISVLNTKPQFCKINSCLEDQEPCDQLSEKTGCLCPGISGADEPPHPPVIQTVLPVSNGDNSGKVEVQWCAPSSVVTGYRVLVEGGEGDALEFGEALRRGLVGSLEVGTKVEESPCFYLSS